MFELLAKLGSQNYKELMKIVDSQINHDCLDSIEKIAIIKLLERLFSLSEGSSLKAELFILIAQTAFHSDSLSTIRQRVDEYSDESVQPFWTKVYNCGVEKLSLKSNDFLFLFSHRFAF